MTRPEFGQPQEYLLLKVSPSVIIKWVLAIVPNYPAISSQEGIKAHSQIQGEERRRQGQVFTNFDIKPAGDLVLAETKIFKREGRVQLVARADIAEWGSHSFSQVTEIKPRTKGSKYDIYLGQLAITAVTAGVSYGELIGYRDKGKIALTVDDTDRKQIIVIANLAGQLEKNLKIIEGSKKPKGQMMLREPGRRFDNRGEQALSLFAPSSRPLKELKGIEHPPSLSWDDFQAVDIDQLRSQQVDLKRQLDPEWISLVTRLKNKAIVKK